MCGSGALVLLALLLVAPSASAHVRSTTGYSEVTQHDNEIRYELSLEYELLAAAVGLGEKALGAASDESRRAALESSQERIATYLEPNVRVFLDGIECHGVADSIGVRQRDDRPYAVVSLAYQCPAPSGSFELRYGVFSDETAVVDEHINVVDYESAARVVVSSSTAGTGSCPSARQRRCRRPCGS